MEPKMGIDIEGYGENAINLEKPLNIQIRNNIVRGGDASSIYNFNGYGVIIEGNQTDSSISYGFATETIIANNLIRAVGGGVSKAGITSLGVSLGQTENNVIIIGNMIDGFEKGIDVRGDSVHITGNKISLFEDAAVSVYMANRILIEGNHIESGTNTRLRSASLRIYQSDSVVFSNNTIYSVIDAAMVRGTNILNSAEGYGCRKGKQGSTAITLFKKDNRSSRPRIPLASLGMQRLSYGGIDLSIIKTTRSTAARQGH
ncbi:right-handed parallel beta-helix repeat-containing protein [Bacillus sp. FJAT-53060]|uniref:right-handed parallel beta-helix repeat-containing protein n=1 Tax=Bacillus sp. FJAT-53060 TaxID=3127666 RepID=UPI0030135B26